MNSIKASFTVSHTHTHILSLSDSLSLSLSRLSLTGESNFLFCPVIFSSLQIDLKSMMKDGFSSLFSHLRPFLQGENGDETEWEMKGFMRRRK